MGDDDWKELGMAAAVPPDQPAPTIEEHQEKITKRLKEKEADGSSG